MEKFARLIITGALALLLFSPLYAVNFTDTTPWNEKVNGPDAAAGGFYINLGITGARAKLIESNLKCLVVTYVFENTPAYGKLKKDDVIIGVNNRPFEVAHKNGYGMDKFGGEGPLMDFGNALEESQAEAATDKGSSSKSKKSDDPQPGKGILLVDVMRNKEKVQVVINIGTKYGKYSDSFPNNDKKSALIVSELYEYLAKNQSGNGTWGSAEADCFGALALLASGDKKYLPNVERSARNYATQTSSKYDPNAGGLVVWNYTFAGIVLSEYYLATGEKWVLPELEEIRDWLMKTQYIDKKSQLRSDRDETKNEKLMTRMLGGWGHNPGFEGYGPMCITTSQACMALALMSRCGIQINRERHEMALAFLERGTGTTGYVWYNAGASKNTRGNWADMGRTGSTALANQLCDYGDAKYQQQADLITTMLSDHVESFPDTHASPPLGMGWQAAATFFNPAGFEHLMRYHKWWFSLAQCPDGSFYYQPNRDNNRAYVGNLRHMMSAVMAFIFSVKNKNLHITGASQSGQFFALPSMVISAEDITPKTKSIYQSLAGNYIAKGQSAVTKLKGDMEEKLTNPRYKKDAIEKELNVLLAFQQHIDAANTALKNEADYLASVGDMYKLQELLNTYKKGFSGLPAFDAMTDHYFPLFKTDDVKAEIDAGKIFYAAVENAQHNQEIINANGGSQNTNKDPLAPLRKFIEKYANSAYTPVAQAIIDEMTKYPLAIIQPKRFFKVQKKETVE